MPDDILHVPPAWDAAARHIRRQALRRILVVGATDAGKSTVCRFLAEKSARAGRSTALIDTDVGQKIVALPLTFDRLSRRMAPQR